MKIYLITDSVTNKQYVGSTIQTLEQRFAGHCCTTNKTLISKAINATGQEHFSIELLEEVSDDLDRTREGHWIDTLGTIAPQGYNATNVSKTNSTKRRPGAKAKPETQKKRSYTLSLSPGEISELERQAAGGGVTTSRWVAARLKLDKGTGA